MEDTHHSQSCQSLSQLPTLVWTHACKHLRFKDLTRLLFEIHPNVDQACLQTFNIKRPIFALRNDRVSTHRRNFDYLNARSMAVLQHLGRYFRNIFFHTQSFHLSPDTLRCMKRVFITNDNALKSLEIGACDLSYSDWFNSGIGCDWNGFLHGFVTARPHVKIELSLDLYCLPPFNHRYSSYFHQTPSDLRCQLLTSLVIEQMEEHVHDPNNPLYPMLLFLPKFANLRELSLNVYFIAEELLSKLAHGNKALKVFYISYTPYHGVMRFVSAEAWREFAVAFPQLRVECNLCIETPRDDTFDGLRKVFKPSTPMAVLQVTYPETQSFFQLLTWCKTFAGTLRFISITIPLSVSFDPQHMKQPVKDFCDESSCFELLNATLTPEDEMQFFFIRKEYESS